MGPVPVNIEMAAGVGEPLLLTVYVADDALVQPDERALKVPLRSLNRLSGQRRGEV